MPTFISLLNWTDQGIRAYKDTVKRAEVFAAELEEVGARLVELYWTVGPYDLVGIIEAPDEESAVAGLLRLGSAGNARSTTMRAFDRGEISRLIARDTE